jgi:hypothetical protein
LKRSPDRGFLVCPLYDHLSRRVGDARDSLQEVLADQRSVRDLHRYYSPDSVPGQRAFAGRQFEFLGAGRAQGGDENQFTPADLLAVQCLSVTVPIEVTLNLLEGDLGREISALLSKVPTDIKLGTADARSLVEDGAKLTRPGTCWKRKMTSGG